MVLGSAEMKEQICATLTEIFILIDNGEYSQALILFTKIAFVINLEDESRPNTVPILFGIVWKAIQNNIAETVDVDVTELEDGAEEIIRTISSAQHRERILFEAETLAGISECLGNMLMGEVVEYTKEVLRVQNGIDAYTDSLLQKIAKSFRDARLAPLPRWL
jgi:hypothetical protein